MSVVVPWSKLLQQPNQVTSELDRVARVRLARRDAEDLILARASTVERAPEGIEAVARLLGSLMRTDAGVHAVLAALPGAFPWTRFLPEGDVRVFAGDFVVTLQGCADIDVFEPLVQFVVEWKHTAEIHADPELHAALTRPLPREDFGPVPPPEG